MVVGAIVADGLAGGACPRRGLEGGRAGVAEVEDASAPEVVAVEVVGGYGAAGTELGKEGAGGVALVNEHKRAVGGGAGLEPEPGDIHAGGLETALDLRSGRVVADGADEGGAAAEPGDGHHGGRGHAAAFQGTLKDGDLLLGAGDAFEQQ